MKNLMRTLLASAMPSALDGVGPLIAASRPIGPGVRQYGKPRSRYMPHQGAREIARRLRQAGRAA